MDSTFYIFTSSLGKTLWLHASYVSVSVSPCVKVLVSTFYVIHITLTERRIGVHMWDAFALLYGEHDAGGFAGIKGH